jgi:hypothetical protein
MKLYLVSSYECIILGVFSSKEKAESMLRKYTTHAEWLEITELELDKETEEFLEYMNK